MPSHESSKSLAHKTINERTSESLDKDDVEKEVAYLVKNFHKFLKMKNNGKSFGKGKFLSFKNDKKDFKKKDAKESSPPQGIVCYECNGHGHLKECLNYLRGKGKVLTTTISDSESSSLNSEDECDGDGNYFAFMAITSVDSKGELRELNEEFGEHIDVEEDEVSNDEEVYLDEGDRKLQVVYNALLEDCGKYAKVVKSVIKKMKRIEKDHKSTLVQLKDTKCEVKNLKEELLNAYSKIKFLKLEVIQANVKVERITTKMLDNTLSSQKAFLDKARLGYTSEGSTSEELGREIKFVSAKVMEKPNVETPIVEKKVVEAKSKAKGKSLPKSQRRSRVKHFCYHCGIRGHTRPNCFKLFALIRADLQHPQGNVRGKQAKEENGGQLIGDIMEMLNISLCLVSFTPRFESYFVHSPPSKDLTQNTHVVWVKKVTYA